MTVLVITAMIFAVVGLVGSIVPGLPGPPISWVGLFLIYLAGSSVFGHHVVSMVNLIVWLAVTVIVSVMDYTIPSSVTKLLGGSQAGSRGATIGMIIGIFFTPIGMIPCSILGAFLAEWLQENKGIGASVKSALGAFLGFLIGTGMKLIVSAIMAYIIIF